MDLDLTTGSWPSESKIRFISYANSGWGGTKQNISSQYQLLSNQFQIKQELKKIENLEKPLSQEEELRQNVSSAAKPEADYSPENTDLRKRKGDFLPETETVQSKTAAPDKNLDSLKSKAFPNNSTLF